MYQKSGIALKSVPKAPKHLSKREVVEWNRVWEVLVPLGTAGSADVLAVEQVARAAARINEAWNDPELRPSTLVAMLRLHKELLRELGLTPASRYAVRKLEGHDDEEKDLLD